MSALTGFNAIVNNESIDLLYIFEAYTTTQSGTVTGFQKNGVDLRAIISGWQGGAPNPLANNTGFKLSSGADIASLFQKKRTFFSNQSITSGFTITTIWTASHNGIVITVTSNTSPYISRNMGKTYSVLSGLNSRMSSNCKCVAIYDNNIIISSSNGYLTWSNDYGTSWGGGLTYGSIHGVDVFENVAGFIDHVAIYISPIGGGSWITQDNLYNAGIGNWRFLKISKTGNKYIAICSRSNGDLPSSDANQLELYYCTNLNPNSSTNVWQVCTGIKPYTVALSGLRGVCGYFFGTASSPRIQYTTDGGVTWTNSSGVPSSTDNGNFGIRTLNMSGRFCVASSWLSGQRGAYLYSSDYGVNWTRVTDDNSGFPSGAVDRGVMTLAQSTEAYTTAWWRSGTMTETPFPTQNSDPVNTTVTARAQFMSLHNNYALACYNGSYIYYSTNYGNNFSQSTVDGALNASRGWTNTAIYGKKAIACDVSFIYYSTNGGATFTKSTFTADPNNLGGSFAGVAIYENYALAVTNGETGKVFVSTDGGVNFSVITNISTGYYRQPSISKRPDNNNYNAVITVYNGAALNNSKIICTNNFTGSTTSDIYRDASINNIPVSTVISGGLIVQLSGNNGVVCCHPGSDTAKCFAYTTDGGSTWSYSNAVVPSRYIVSVAIDGSFCVAAFGTSYYISKDSGVNWTAYSVPVLGGSTDYNCSSVSVSDGFAVLNVRYVNGTAAGAYNYYGRIL